MPELTSRLRRRTSPTAVSSDPDGCLTTRRHAGVVDARAPAAAAMAVSTWRFSPGAACSMIESGEIAVKSTAALKAARRLPGLWFMTGLLLAIPRSLRDWCYDVFAARRYRWFGKREACMIPTAEMRSRFLA